MPRNLAGLLFLGALAACGAPRPGEEGSKAAEAPPAIAAPQATITVVPGVMRSCDPPVVATVTWDSRPVSVAEVNILVAGPDATAPALFAMVEGSGTMQTGAWTVAGTNFFLTDRQSRRLASVTVKSEPC